MGQHRHGLEERLQHLARWTSAPLAETQPVLSMLGPFDWLFDNFQFRDWPGSIFARPSWTTITNTLSIGLSLGVSGLLLLEQRARRLGKALPERACRRAGVAITVVGFLLYFDFFVPNTRYTNYYHRHELYHYYLGSKYFTEVGYKRLYACTAIAEIDLGFAEHVHKKKIRNLAGDNLLSSWRPSAWHANAALNSRVRRWRGHRSCESFRW